MRRASACLVLTVMALALGARPAVGDDLPAGKGTPAAMALGSRYGSEISGPKDADWVNLPLKAGDNILLTQWFGCVGMEVQLLDPKLRRVFTVGWRHERGGAGEYTAKMTGTHLLAVRPLGWNAGDCGSEGQSGPSYPAEWNVAARRECAAHARTTCSLPLNGKRIVGSSNFHDDQDWFRIDVTKPGAYAFAVEGMPDTVYSLRRANGSVVAEYHDDFTTNLAKGRYFLAVRRAGAEYSEPFEITARPAL